MKKETHNFPTKVSPMPSNYGFKSDPEAKACVAKLGGVICTGATMMEKRKLPLEHGREYKDGER